MIKTKKELEIEMQLIDNIIAYSNNDKIILNLKPQIADSSDGSFLLLDPDDLEVKTRGDKSILYRVKIKLPISHENLKTATNSILENFKAIEKSYVYRRGFSLPGEPTNYVRESENGDLEIRFYATYDI